ncbi:MAG: SDR family oxidoreductase [Pseudomonadota bacterium]
MSFQGKAVLITGGATGIGKGIASHMGLLGAHVAICSRKQEALQSACEELQALGIRAIAQPCDIRDPADVQATAAWVVTEFGSLDVLVNNAAGNFPALIENLSYNGFKTVIDIDLNGTFNMTKACYDAWFKEHGGNIINISAPFEGAGIPYQAHAAAAKAGVNSLTRTCAVEWRKQGIRVNAIEPGAVDNTAGVDRLAASLTGSALVDVPPCTPTDIAKAVAFLASEEAAYINGQCIAVDSGTGVDLLKLNL